MLLIWQEFLFKKKYLSKALQHRLGLIGDLGQTEDSLKTLLHLNKLDVASVLNVGDLSYADSYQPRWDSWNRLLEVSLSSCRKTVY